VEPGERLELLDAGGLEREQHLAPIVARALASNETARLELVDERDRRVMLEAESLGDGSNRGLAARRQSAQGEQELVLLRLDVGAARGALAEGEEAPELVAKRGEGAVVGARHARHALATVGSERTLLPCF